MTAFVVAVGFTAVSVLGIRIYDILKDIRNELRLMRTNGVSFDPPRRGR